MTGSRYVPTIQRRQNAPRGGVKTDYTMRLSPQMRLAADRTAKAIGVSLPYLFQLAAERFIGLIHDEQEMGLYPVPGKLAAEELDLIESVAAAAGLPAGRWAAHTLLDAASRAALAEAALDNTERKQAA